MNEMSSWKLRKARKTFVINLILDQLIMVIIYPPVAGELRQTEGDSDCGDEDTVKDGQHRQNLPEVHL